MTGRYLKGNPFLSPMPSGAGSEEFAKELVRDIPPFLGGGLNGGRKGFILGAQRRCLEGLAEGSAAPRDGEAEAPEVLWTRLGHCGAGDACQPARHESHGLGVLPRGADEPREVGGADGLRGHGGVPPPVAPGRAPPRHRRRRPGGAPGLPCCSLRLLTEHSGSPHAPGRPEQALGRGRAALGGGEGSPPPHVDAGKEKREISLHSSPSFLPSAPLRSLFRDEVRPACSDPHGLLSQRLCFSCPLMALPSYLGKPPRPLRPLSPCACSSAPSAAVTVPLPHPIRWSR